ncbi:MAG: hypothetical protein ABIW76_12035 [Fibrobacteria bacterium]
MRNKFLPDGKTLSFGFGRDTPGQAAGPMEVEPVYGLVSRTERMVGKVIATRVISLPPSVTWASGRSAPNLPALR